MGKDSKIAVIAFLTFIVYGVFNLIEGKWEYVLPYPLIAIIIPAVSLIFFFFKIKSLNSLFFLFYPLMVVQFALEPIISANIEWLGYLGAGSLVFVWIANLSTLKSWGKYKWLSITSCLLYTLISVIYLFWIEYLPFVVPFVTLVSLTTLIINPIVFQQNPVLKRQYVLYALSTGLLIPLMAFVYFG